MTRHQYFRDSITGDQHEYDMHGFARFHARIFGGSGVSNTKNAKNPYDDFEYKTREGMECELGSGFAVYEGFMLEEDEPTVMTHDSADPNNGRIDRVVIQFNLNAENAEFLPVIKKGTPKLNPSAPALTQTRTTFEIPIAQVKINADEASIKQSNITDERVGNYLPLNNLQRGVQVDEYGMVEMPNQSFIKTMNHDVTIQGGVSLSDGGVPITLGDIEEDFQNEVSGSKTITAKGSGIYHIWAEIGYSYGNGPQGGKIDLYLFVNGKQSFPLGSSTFTVNQDKFVIGSGFDKINEGDEMEIRYTVVGHNGNTDASFTRVRMTKTA